MHECSMNNKIHYTVKTTQVENNSSNTSHTIIFCFDMEIFVLINCTITKLCQSKLGLW